MARTNRKAALASAAQNASVDALDDLNLDDMFNEGDDTLFDGLEIDLDGMGDIANSSEKKKVDASKVDKKVNTVAAAPSKAEVAVPKRRTTKRKIKAPPTIDDDDDEDYEAPKKKRRTTTKKGKTTKASAKSKTPTTTMPPPFSRGTEPKGMVAVQKRTASSQHQLVRQSSTSSAASMVAASNASRASSSPFLPRESMYCGIRPSNTEFYPFTPASVPPEPTMTKAHRTPLFQKVSSCFTATTQLPPNEAMDAKETDGIYKLLSADLDLMYNEKSSRSLDEARRAMLSQAVGIARKSVAQTDKNQLMKDLYSLTLLLKRQYDFLNINAANMERWCRQNFSPQDYSSVFGAEAAAAVAATTTTRRGGSRSGRSTPRIPGTLFASLKSSIVKVKVKCSGFKAPNKVLLAHVRLPGTAAPASTKSDSSRSASSKRRKVAASGSDAGDRLSVSSVQEPVVPKEVSYVDMKPVMRRQRITDAIAERAQSLEQQMKEAREKYRRSIERQRTEQQKVVDDDEILSLNTMTMWKWLEKSPHFANYSEADLREVLEGIWEPELLDGSLPPKPAEMLRPVGQVESNANPDARPGDSVFLRLQSLLVDEGSDDNDECDEEEGSLLNGGNVFLPKASNEQSPDELDVIDLSGFSLDERALIHLNAAGLVDDIRSALEAAKRNNAARETQRQSDLDNAILSMQDELVDQFRVNNARLGFLETAAMANLESMKQLKKREDGNAAVVARYNQLLKKQKEAKKSARQKPTKNDSDWVPW